MPSVRALILFLILWSTTAAPSLRGQAVTEILYDPDSAPDNAWEWVELYNDTDTALDLAGYVFDDDDGLPLTTANVAGGVLPPGGLAVLFNADATSQDALAAAWKAGVVFVGVTDWPGLNQDGDRIGVWRDLSTYGARDFDRALDVVAYETIAPWPRAEGGASVYLTRRGDDPAGANDDGSRWGTSLAGMDAAYTGAPAGTNAASSVGSPGILPDPWLPVELVSFSALVDGEAVRLTWTTAGERNNAGFEVQVADAGPFRRIAFVEGGGTTDAPRTYTYRHPTDHPGRARYRLKQIDFDGTFSFSPARTVHVDRAGDLRLDAVYPNPFNPAATVRFSVRSPQRVRIELLDVSGKRVRTLFDGAVDADTVREIPLDGNGLASGLYFVRLRGATSETVRRIVAHN